MRLCSSALAAALIFAGTADAFVAPSCVVPRARPSGHAAAARPALLRPAPFALRMTSDDAQAAPPGPSSRKAKNQQKKAAKAEDSAAKREQRKKVNAILDGLFDQIESEKRDLKSMNEMLDKIGEFKPEAVSPALKGDWKLVFVDTAEAINQVGSALGKLPGSSIVDLFATFNVKGGVDIQEVVRVAGPFPTVRNLLSGTWEYKDKAAGFTGDSVSEPRLQCTYTEMVDGRNQKTTLETGFKQKVVQLDVRYVDSDVLVAFIRNDGLEPLRLVFEKVWMFACMCDNVCDSRLRVLLIQYSPRIFTTLPPAPLLSFPYSVSCTCCLACISGILCHCYLWMSFSITKSSIVYLRRSWSLKRKWAACFART